MAEKLNNPFKINELVTTVNDLIDESESSYTAGEWIDINENKEISVKGSTNIDLLDITQHYYCLLATVNTNTACFYIPDYIDGLEEGISIVTILYVYYDYPLNKLTKYSSTVRITKLEDANKTYKIEPTIHSTLYLPTISYDCLGFDYNSADSIRFTQVTRLNTNGLDHDFFVDSSNNVLPTQKAVKTYVDNKDDSFVHKAGSEIITGGKTFQGQLIINNNLKYANNAVSKGQNPATTKQWEIINFDKNGFSVSNRLSCWNTSLNSNGDVTTGLFAYKNQNLSSTNTSINVTYPINGDPYTSAPIPTDTTSTSNTQIATTGWVNSIGNNVVHLTGNETITGNKIFKIGYDGVTLQNREANSYSDLSFKDESNNLIGKIRGGVNASNQKYVNLFQNVDFIITKQPTEDTTNSSQIDTVGARNTKLANYVRLTEDQTISGTKTFTGIQKLNGNTLKCFSFAKGTNPSSTQYANIYLTDNTETNGDNTTLGRFRTQVNSSGLVSTYITSFKNATGNLNSSIGIHYPATGDPYTSAPTPSASDNSTKIATTAFVKAQGYLTSHQSLSNYVTLNTTQTISGAKTFTADPNVTRDSAGFNLNASNITKGTAPSADVLYSRYRFRDKDGELMSSVYGIYRSNKSNQIGFEVRKANAAADTAYTRLGIGVMADGSYYTTCPTCDDAGSIVTTVNKSKATNGYFQLGNGLIVQWGYKANSGTHTVTVTLPKAFTTTNYAVTISRYANEWAEAVVMQTNNYTKTSFDFTANDPGVHWIAIGY